MSAIDSDAFGSIGKACYPLRKDHALLYAVAKAEVVAAQELQHSMILEHVQLFRTISEHSRECARKTSLNENKCRELLIQAVNHKLLVSSSDFIEACRKSGQTCRNGEIDRFALLLKGQPENLRNAVAAIMNKATANKRGLKLLVRDTSTDAYKNQKTKAACKSLMNSYGVPIICINNEDKKRFMGQLIKLGKFPEEIVEYALGGVPGSDEDDASCLNYLLLKTAGHMILHAEDNTTASFCASNRGAGLRISSTGDPTELLCFDDRQSALESLGLSSENIIECHESMLGKSVGELAGSDAYAVDLGQLDAAAALALWKHGGCIRITRPGICGKYHIGLVNRSLTDMLSHKQDSTFQKLYSAALTDRYILRGVDRPTIAMRAFSVSPQIGIDNRTLIPPFIPATNSYGGLYEILLRAVSPESYCGLVPMWIEPKAAVGKSAERDCTAMAVAQYTGFSTEEIIAACIGMAKTASQNTTSSMILLGRHLCSLGNMSATDFTSFISQKWLEALSERLTIVEYLLQMRPAIPDYAIADIRNYQRRIRDAINHQSSMLAWDLQPFMKPTCALIFIRGVVLRFGKLLTYWPSMMEAST